MWHRSPAKSWHWNHSNRVGQAICYLLLLGLMTSPAQGVLPEDSAPLANELRPVVLATAESISVYPSSLELSSPRRFAQLAITGHYADGEEQDLTRAAEIISSDPQIATVSAGMIHPVAQGQAEILIRAAGRELRVPVTVTGFHAADPVSFQYEALVALSKHDCNSGACHGSPSGKGGFRLSLRAYDPVLDKETLIREFYNRRTDVQNPAASLLLQKPTLEVAHGGGRQLRVEDPSYALLHDWIAEGLQEDPADVAHCQRIELFPKQRVLRSPAHTQQVVARAHFSDGTVRDVTPLVVYGSSDESVATVTPTGLVIGHGQGDAAIVVRYLDKVETAHFTFLESRPDFVWQPLAQQNYIDELVDVKLQQMQIQPAELCTDQEFIRRIYLDLTGQLPPAATAESFLAESTPNKREIVIDQLLASREHAEFWALKWSDLFRLSNKFVTQPGVHKFRQWLVHSVETNQPYDEFVEELLTSTGSTYDHPPANYFRTAKDAPDATETTSQLFLGIRIQCAKCHNHPFEHWTQDNYYGISAFFNRVQRKPGTQTGEQIIWMARQGEVTQPRTNQKMAPWLPAGGTPQEFSPEEDRRQLLVQWLRDPQNPYFAHAEVNRIWGHLFGRGIVDPVDDFRASNPPVNGPLLDALASDFITSGYDRRHLLRTICNSRVYQQSTSDSLINGEAEHYFAATTPRLLTAEQLLDAVCSVTGIQQNFAGLPAGTRATQLPSPDAQNPFLRVFGQPPREIACECERASEANLAQALQMINGTLVQEKLMAEGNHLRALLASGQTPAEVVRWLYLQAVSRPPTEVEVQTALAHIEASAEPVAGLEDICWALLNSKEFLFQH